MTVETRNRYIDEATRALFRAALTTNCPTRPELPVLATVKESRHAWRVAKAIAVLEGFEPHPSKPRQVFDAHHLVEAVQYVQGGEHIILLALELVGRLGNRDKHARTEYKGRSYSWSLGKRIRDVAIVYIDLFDDVDVD